MSAFLGTWLITITFLSLGALATVNAQIASSLLNNKVQSPYEVDFTSSKARSHFPSKARSQIPRAAISHVIVVDQSGHGDFDKLQPAIDAVPPNNRKWIEIQVKAGVYSEKVEIPINKPYISLVGENKQTTVIQWWDGGGSDTVKYATFSVFADSFVARDITFMNTYHPQIISQAPAVIVYGDKIAFYQCGFIGVQDTVTDFVGRHYFEGCYIEGYIDFIWGYGQSIYNSCIINVTSGAYDDRIYGAGYITAQGRSNIQDNSGFVFKYCTVVGTSFAYLGRPYQSYSTVVFYKSFLSDIVVPQGWNPGFTNGHGSSITHEEIGCTGPGSDTSQRVKWGKFLNSDELSSLLNTNLFINQDKWIQKQPLPTTGRMAQKSFFTPATNMKKHWRQIPLTNSFPFAHPRLRSSLSSSIP